MRRATVLLVALAGGGTGVLACSGYEGGGDARIVPSGSSEGGADAAVASVTDSGGRPDSAVPGATPVPLSTSLVASYRFDGTSSDSSGASRHLSLIGPTPNELTYPQGIVNNAARLPNASHYLAGPSDSFSLEADFSVQAWVRIDQLSPGSELVLIGRFSGAQGWSLSIRASSGPAFRVLPTFEMTASQPVTAATWHHVVARRQSSVLDLHYDGARVANGTNPNAISSPPGTPLVVGREITPQTSPGARLLDEVAIWTRALTDSEISQLYNGGAGRAVVPGSVP